MVISKLRETREALGLKQKDVAKFLGVDHTTYSGWETGKDTIPLKYLIRYSNNYGYSLDYLYGINEENVLYKKLDVDLKVIGDNLRKLRKENNYTLKDIAKKLNCHLSTYGYYEEGKNLISTTFLYALRGIYSNISFDKILGKKEKI